MKKTESSKINVLSTILGVSLFLLFTSSLSSSVVGGDSGDFLTSIATHGIPHPSGYPLYTLLGILFSYLPLSATLPWKVGLVTVIFSTLSIIILFRMITKLTSLYIGMVSSLVFAFFHPFWFYTETVEVFSLFIFFLVSIMSLLIRFLRNPNNKTFYLVCLISGLSLTNNLTIVLVFPIITISLLSNLKRIWSFKIISTGFALFFIGLLPYLYLPIAASGNPVINWGNPSNFANFWHHISRADYRWTPDSSASLSLTSSMRVYATYWSIHLNIALGALGIIGALYLLFKKNYKEFMVFSTLFILLGPFFLYIAGEPANNLSTIRTLERFLIQSVTVAFVFIAYGFEASFAFIKRVVKNDKLKHIALQSSMVAFLIFPLMSFINGHKTTNLSNVYIGDRFGTDILQSVPRDAVIIPTRDSYVFNSLYRQLVFEERTDVIIPGRSAGYKRYLEQSELENWELYAKEAYHDHNSLNEEIGTKALLATIQKQALFSENPQTGIIRDLNEKFISIPYGLVYQIILEKDYTLTNDEYIKRVQNITKEYQIQSFITHEEVINDSILFSEIRRTYAFGFYNIARFLEDYYDDYETAKVYRAQAIKTDPSFAPAITE